jgi:uncharacterized repeat protein (TIGR03803 family)
LKNLLLIFFILLTHTISHAQAKLWGMTSTGGIDDFGVIFSTDVEGTSLKKHFDFVGNYAANPDDILTLANNGKLYGMTSNIGGGFNGPGLIFEYNPATNKFTKTFQFDRAVSGSSPVGSLTLGPNGKLYGMTASGGAENKGVLFEFDPVTNIFVKKVDFSGLSNGARPVSNVIVGANGNIYGATRFGGTYDMGVLFEFDISSNIFIKKIDFDGIVKGSEPSTRLTLHGNGKIYGVTSNGGPGAGSYGILFEYDPISGVLTKKVDFLTLGSGGGRVPSGSLTIGPDNLLYGMTTYGGTKFAGTLFKYDPLSGSFINLINLDKTPMGGCPRGSLMLSGGKFYGVTNTGGIHDKGVLFEFDPATNLFIKKIDFDEQTSECFISNGSLSLGGNGKFYWMNSYGGANGYGALFEYDALASSHTKKIDFGVAVNGGGPSGDFANMGNGKLYALAHGGTDSIGVLFEYDITTNTYVNKIDFGLTKIGFPTGNLTKGENGKLYGVTHGGTSPNYNGTLFEYEPTTNTLTKKIDFDGPTMGRDPGGLVFGNNGLLYGVTYAGGIHDMGVLFEFNTITNAFSKKLDFDGLLKGKYPTRLMLGNDGKLYGLTDEGGTNNLGVLFEYNPVTSAFAKRVDFDGMAKGKSPKRLTSGSNGKLYGLTYEGGTNNLGVLFEFDPITNTFAKKIDFDGLQEGSTPRSLTLSSNNKFYGLISGGGESSKGALFEYDPVTNLLEKKLDFDGTNGSNPTGGLLLIKALPTINWSNPTEISYGIALSNTQLNATSSIEGTFVYTPSLGTLLNAGANQVLSVLFTPTDIQNYETVTKQVVINITKSNQSIAFPPLPQKTFGEEPFALSATSSSNLSITFASSNEAVLTISENVGTIVGSGVSTITASQPGNQNFNAAEEVKQVLIVVTCTNPDKPSISQANNSSLSEIILTSSIAPEGGTYQWFNNGLIIEGATFQSYSTSEAGSYFVRITVPGGCSTTSDILAVVITSLESLNASELMVFPNPAIDWLTISLEEFKGEKIISLQQTSGRQMTQQKTLANELTIRISEYPPGMYLVKVSDGKYFNVVKFIKQ